MVGLSHSFFQKSMRTSFLTIQRNAMSNQQKYSILAIDLVRRLSNINKNIVSKKEITRVIKQIIQIPVTSVYDRRQSREAVVSGIRGLKSKIRRREEEGKGFYTPSTSTLASRYRKTLTAKTSCYKTNKKNNQKRNYVLMRKKR